jgi:hypothetical protein
LPAVPKMVIPRAGGARARAVSGEEFDRMITAVPKVRPDDSPAWVCYLTGLWLSGLRLEESLALSWDEDAPFAIDLTGRRPALTRRQLSPLAPSRGGFCFSFFPPLTALVWPLFLVAS